MVKANFPPSDDPFGFPREPKDSGGKNPIPQNRIRTGSLRSESKIANPRIVDPHYQAKKRLHAHEASVKRTFSRRNKTLGKVIDSYLSDQLAFYDIAKPPIAKEILADKSFQEDLEALRNDFISVEENSYEDMQAEINHRATTRDEEGDDAVDIESSPILLTADELAALKDLDLKDPQSLNFAFGGNLLRGGEDKQVIETPFTKLSKYFNDILEKHGLNFRLSKDKFRHHGKQNKLLILYHELAKPFLETDKERSINEREFIRNIILLLELGKSFEGSPFLEGMGYEASPVAIQHNTAITENNVRNGMSDEFKVLREIGLHYGLLRETDIKSSAADEAFAMQVAAEGGGPDDGEIMVPQYQESALQIINAEVNNRLGQGLNKELQYAKNHPQKIDELPVLNKIFDTAKLLFISNTPSISKEDLVAAFKDREKTQTLISGLLNTALNRTSKHQQLAINYLPVLIKAMVEPYDFGVADKLPADKDLKLKMLSKELYDLRNYSRAIMQNDRAKKIKLGFQFFANPKFKPVLDKQKVLIKRAEFMAKELDGSETAYELSLRKGSTTYSVLTEAQNLLKQHDINLLQMLTKSSLRSDTIQRMIDEVVDKTSPKFNFMSSKDQATIAKLMITLANVEAHFTSTLRPHWSKDPLSLAIRLFKDDRHPEREGSLLAKLKQLSPDMVSRSTGETGRYLDRLIIDKDLKAFFDTAIDENHGEKINQFAEQNKHLFADPGFRGNVIRMAKKPIDKVEWLARYLESNPPDYEDESLEASKIYVAAMKSVQAALIKEEQAKAAG